MYIDSDTLEKYEEKISNAIENKSWDDVIFLIRTVLSPNHYYDTYMDVFIDKVCSYFERYYSNHPERVEPLLEITTQWVKSQKNSSDTTESELTAYYTALACMYKKTADKENMEKYFKKAETHANAAINEDGSCEDYKNKAYLYIRFNDYDKVPAILKKMELLAIEEYDEKMCQEIQESYKEQTFYSYSF